MYLQYAVSTASFVEEKIKLNKGKLSRNLKVNAAPVNGFLDDYAFLSSSYVRLYQLTFDKQWLDRTKQLVSYLLSNFYDSISGMFFYSAHSSDSNLPKRIQITDNAMPASNAVIAGVLYDPGIFFDKEDYREKSKALLSKMTNQLSEGQTNYFSSWCMLAGLFSYGTNEVAIMGSEAVGYNLQLQKKYLPVSIFMGSVAEENLPILQDKKVDGKTLIYVCTNRICKLPVNNMEKALEQLIKP